VTRAWRATGAVLVALLLAGAATAASDADDTTTVTTTTGTNVSTVVSTVVSTTLTAPTSTSTTPDNTTTKGPSGLRLVQIGMFTQPVGIVGPPVDESQVFVVERLGKIALVNKGKVQARPFLNLHKLVDSSVIEQGLLGLAFSPDYAKNGIFYVDYTSLSGDVVIAQFERSGTNANLANPNSERILLKIPHQPYGNGGDIMFGPDGDLYIGVGDSGTAADPTGSGSQDLDSLVGKILRISPNGKGGYTIPKTNPFYGTPGELGQIWDYGLRQPWRFSFDPTTGAMIIADVGNNTWEEVDYAPKGTFGVDYGWPIWEGDQDDEPGVTAPNPVFPVLELPHTDSYCALIGGYVVRDPTVPALKGMYLYGDLCRGPIMAVRLSPGRASDLHATGLSVSNTTAFGEDSAGHIYVSSLNGQVYRIEQK